MGAARGPRAGGTHGVGKPHPARSQPLSRIRPVALDNAAPTKRSATTTTIWNKILMAVSGLLFILFVLGHMLGNLKILQSHEAFDTYAHHLRTMGEPILPYEGALWIVRLVLLAAVLAHVVLAVKLWGRAKKGRSVGYAMKKSLTSSLASRTMRWGGIALLLFVVFHILHFTTKTIHPQGELASPAANYVESFEIWWVLLIYVLAMAALGMHIFHGFFSAMQTLGLTKTKNIPMLRTIGAVLAALVVVGFLVPPFAVFLDLVN